MEDPAKKPLTPLSRSRIFAFWRESILRRRLVIAALVPIACTSVWFLCVDWSWFVEECPDCRYYANVREYRVLTFPITREVTPFPTGIQRIAADLGQPCRHPRYSRWHKHRWWGLYYCAAPCWNGTYSLNDEDTHAWYDTVAEEVRLMGAADAELGKQWHRRVILEHDWDYWHAFAERLRNNTRESGDAPE